MTEVYDGNAMATAELEPLPTEIKVTTAFAQRMPTQRVIDLVERVEHGSFAELAQHQPFRLIAFRALLRDYPGAGPDDVVVARLRRGSGAGRNAGPYRDRVYDDRAAFLRYWRMTPAEVDELGEQMMAAMVRFMQREAAAIERQSRDAKRGR